MNILTNFLLSQSVIIPIIAAVIHLRRLDKIYYPFFIVLLLGLLAESASFILINTFRTSNAPVIKIYSLLECCLILYQLYLWENLYRRKRSYIYIAAFCVAFWFTETVVYANLNTFSPYFREFYAFIIAILSIDQINTMMFYHEKIVVKNPRFLICLGFIIIFIYQIIYEASFSIDSAESAVANKIIIGFGYLNFAINLLYAVAIYFIPRRKEDIIKF